MKLVLMMVLQYIKIYYNESEDKISINQHWHWLVNERNNGFPNKKDVEFIIPGR